MAATKRWKNRPQGSTWGDFGPDDQLGRLNLLTPEKVKQGIAEVKEGLAFCLSLPLDYPGGTALNQRRNCWIGSGWKVRSDRRCLGIKFQCKSRYAGNAWTRFAKPMNNGASS